MFTGKLLAGAKCGKTLVLGQERYILRLTTDGYRVMTILEERVILVDQRDREQGSEEKLAAHRAGRLHRAFSVFVLDERGRLLLQRRSATKYHSPLRWSNTCCGHPRPDETTDGAAARRLQEEMGFVCELREAYAFTYRADLGEGLIEHEIDHVFLGDFGGVPKPNPEEVDSWCWAEPDELWTDIMEHPARYSAWLPEAFGGLRDRRLV